MLYVNILLQPISLSMSVFKIDLSLFSFLSPCIVFHNMNMSKLLGLSPIDLQNLGYLVFYIL